MQTQNSGPGIVNITVNDGVVQAKTVEVSKGTFIVEFTPTTAEAHVVQLEFSNLALEGLSLM